MFEYLVLTDITFLGIATASLIHYQEKADTEIAQLKAENERLSMTFEELSSVTSHETKKLNDQLNKALTKNQGLCCLWYIE